jgi:hypothetical protein
MSKKTPVLKNQLLQSEKLILRKVKTTIRALCDMKELLKAQY